MVLLTKAFKTLTVMGDLLIAYQKFGVVHEMFTEVFEKAQRYLEQDPKTKMQAPKLMWQGVHEYRCNSAAPPDFWKFLEDNALIDNGFDEIDITMTLDKLIKKKVLAFSATGQKSHQLGRQLFNEKSAIPKRLSARSMEEVEAIKFVLHFSGEQDCEKLKHFERMVRDKERPIANALLSFQNGKTIVNSALEKAKAAESQRSKYDAIINELADIYAEFPKRDTAERCRVLSNQIKTWLGCFDYELMMDKAIAISNAFEKIAKTKLELCFNDLGVLLAKFAAEDELNFTNTGADAAKRDEISNVTDSMAGFTDSPMAGFSSPPTRTS